MGWVRLVVEIATNDDRDDAAVRIERETRRALEHRFSAVVVELDRNAYAGRKAPFYPPGSCEHAP